MKNVNMESVLENEWRWLIAEYGWLYSQAHKAHWNKTVDVLDQ